MHPSSRSGLHCFLALLALAVSVRADSQGAAAIEPAQFMRIMDDGASGGKLQTATVTYQNSAGQTVRLVGAIHIGEQAYYEHLNREFAGDDAVLYELVTSNDAALPRRGEAAPPVSDNPISAMQHFMKDALNLSFQLDVIDYRAKNFVHADMDKETFEKMQADRGETFEMLMLRQMMKAFAPSAAPDTAAPAQDETGRTVQDLIQLLTRPDMERQIKLLFARQLSQLQKQGNGLDAMGGAVILTERNKTAMKVLADTLAAGRKKISVFYGAAHMPDMSERLRAMGFTAVSCDWNTAWDLTIRPSEPSAAQTLVSEAIKALQDAGE